MNRILIAGVGALLLTGTLAAEDHGQFLENIRQLTHGGQNAEAHWSPDGTQLVFQSTRDGNKCDQIYVMNADGSDPRMVSTGKGVTTCGYFLPHGQSIVYASTHAAAPECPTRPDRGRSYVWAVYPGYDIYRTSLSGGELTRLTTADGYDAEGTVNWRTGRIVYTSMASGDLDLWSMDLDGGHKSKLTTGTGYDGGAVFSRDGNKLVWRAHHPLGPDELAKYARLLEQNLTAPIKMELYVADQYGLSAKRVTHSGCASFAPQFTPDGKRIIFSSNMNNCDSREFELFLVDLDGSNLEQVTRFYEFTSFPEFSPDGKKLVFTSSHNTKSKYEFNIFVTDWVE